MRSAVVVVLILGLVAACAENSDRSVATTSSPGTSATTSVTEMPIDTIAVTTSSTMSPTSTSEATTSDNGPGESIGITETITITVKDAEQP